MELEMLKTIIGKNLGRNVVREVADDMEFAGKDIVNVKFEEIPVDYSADSLREMLFQIFHRFRVDFYHLEIYIIAFKQILRKYPHSWSYFQDIHHLI